MFLLHTLPLKLNALIFSKVLKILISVPSHLLLKGVVSIGRDIHIHIFRLACTVMSQVSDVFEILSDEPSQGQIDTSADISFLAFEPSIIKGRMRERLWHAQATPECAPLCKSQLKVNHYLSWLIYRMKPQLSNLPLRPRRIPILGLNIWRRLIHRRDSHMSLASIARPYTVIRIILYIKTPAR